MRSSRHLDGLHTLCRNLGPCFRASKIRSSPFHMFCITKIGCLGLIVFRVRGLGSRVQGLMYMLTFALVMQ